MWLRAAAGALIDVGVRDGQDRAWRVAEHVLADGAQDPCYPAARRQDKRFRRQLEDNLARHQRLLDLLQDEQP